MNENFEDIFGEDEDEYNKFKKEFENYKKQSGMFNNPYTKNLIKMRILIYDEFLGKKHKQFRVPIEFLGEVKNLPLQMFMARLNKYSTAIFSIILN